ncbi:ABC-type nitrate/sulfonate/bicarbonate transport system, substrate-binding protein [Amphibacillus marinus]|uniref:ABC-type nitrate/sulfonate/bicarbonate transport system, substrate-binding protein n=1 Tax=Amphibacillus marinus TaxID=872970 RepID=A0A1H8IM91_9BACI|nr:ABC transporter substrate-binding protein [Amphibacillus marinus]SEN70050.1 ABC-type nitrate/sulfonate/bicarbonate transport system, substrate-binding protein [Amphibacillus marinus]
MKKIAMALLGVVLVLLGCNQTTTNSSGDELSIILDWTPNTNHTGIYVAQEKGYFEDENLKVEILLPGQTSADQVVAAGQADIGIGSQEMVTRARVQDVPIISIAAIIQHNTSGFASPIDRNIISPSDFSGMTYGGFGDPIEEALLDALMTSENASVEDVDMINIGHADFFTSVQRDIDFSWIYYGWTGIEAEIRDVELNVQYLTDYADELDYYTPVLFTNEDLIATKPELLRRFVAAVSKGYQDAINNPTDTAKILLEAVPDLNEELVYASQAWLADWYQADAEQWGVQELPVWERYATWLHRNHLIEAVPNFEEAFTNQFLPE